MMDAVASPRQVAALLIVGGLGWLLLAGPTCLHVQDPVASLLDRTNAALRVCGLDPVEMEQLLAVARRWWCGRLLWLQRMRSDPRMAPSDGPQVTADDRLPQAADRP